MFCNPSYNYSIEVSDLLDKSLQPRAFDGVWVSGERSSVWYIHCYNCYMLDCMQIKSDVDNSVAISLSEQPRILLLLCQMLRLPT